VALKSGLVWIRTETVQAIHQSQIYEHGGMPGLRDMGLLESAVNRPRQLFAHGVVNLPELAAAYAYGLIQNHPFIDGNKRTALVTCRLFLDLHWYDMGFSDFDKYHYIRGLAAGRISERQFAELIAGDRPKL
jgi:death on curing protein